MKYEKTVWQAWKYKNTEQQYERSGDSTMGANFRKNTQAHAQSAVAAVLFPRLNKVRTSEGIHAFTRYTSQAPPSLLVV